MSYTDCSIAGCDGRSAARGWCNAHYQRWYKWGDPLFYPPTPEQNFWAKVRKSEACWLWTGPLHSSGKTGYGWTGKALAHRQAYEYSIRPIPDGLQLDHLCRVRLCVNPDHLEPVTAQVNVLRSDAPAAITHRTGKCQRGHEMSGDNLIIITSTGARRCATCVKMKQRERRSVVRA